MNLRKIKPTLAAAAWFASHLGMAAAQQDIEPSDLVRGGLQAMQLVDQSRTGELWDNAAAGAKARVTRDLFAVEVAKARAPLGAPQQRTWTSVSRKVLTDADPTIAGSYVNVEYETRFAGKPGIAVREMVSFHLDADRVWRFSGYVLR